MTYCEHLFNDYIPRIFVTSIWTIFFTAKIELEQKQEPCFKIADQNCLQLLPDRKNVFL